MAFVNRYRPGEVYPNDRTTLAVLLTVPANGKEYGLGDPFVERELSRISSVMGLDRPPDRVSRRKHGAPSGVLRRARG